LVSLPAQNCPEQGVTVADPNATLVAPVKPLPTICTPVPPAADPVRGLTPLTIGGPTASYVYLSKALTALVTPAAVTVTSTVAPAVPGGL
jgi:hypothetical protein